MEKRTRSTRIVESKLRAEGTITDSSSQHDLTPSTSFDAMIGYSDEIGRQLFSKAMKTLQKIRDSEVQTAQEPELIELVARNLPEYLLLKGRRREVASGDVQAAQRIWTRLTKK